MIVLKNEIKVEAVIFDFDGVIVDTEPLHYAAFKRTLEPLGLHFSWQEYIDIYIGFDDRDAFKHAFSQSNKQISVEALHKLIEQKASYFQEIIKKGVLAYPGVKDLVIKLRTNKIPLAICSGALRCDIDPILDNLAIADCFDVIVTADDVAVSKPDPECYNLAFMRLQSTAATSLSKGTTLAIEDTPAGISSARSAQLMVCAVTNSYPKEKLCEATFISDSLLSLI